MTRAGATESADSAVVADALGTLELVPCPACGRRARSLVGRFVSTAVLSAVIAGAFWLASVAMFSRRDAPRWFVIGALIVVCLFALLRLRRALGAASRVEMID